MDFTISNYNNTFVFVANNNGTNLISSISRRRRTLLLLIILILLTRYKVFLLFHHQHNSSDDNEHSSIKKNNSGGGGPSYGTMEENDNFYFDSVCERMVEVFPNITHYKDEPPNRKRPSLAELHEPKVSQFAPRLSKTTELTVSSHHSTFKLGWIQGVLIPCLLNIWGVMLFLRMPWIVAHSGILEAVMIIVISTTVCMLTTLSLSALCTNGEVKGGGIYFIISRSLGPEFGASIGIVLAFANAVSASMNTIGFCESLNDLLKSYYNYKILENQYDAIRLVGVIAIFVMIVICGTGIEWESKAQNVLIFLIVLAMGDFIAGCFVGPQNPVEIHRGFRGLSWDRVSENWKSNYTYSEGVQQSFFTIFSIFFPSVTGIHAGANISGDLKDPSSAIPKGTLLSLLISMISYIVTAVLSGSAAVRSATGNSTEFCLKDCHYGLYYDFSIMQLMAVWGIVIYIGCFAATLSTALTNLLTVPRLIQALGEDRIYPGLEFFAKQYGRNREPIRGYVLTFVISSVFVMIAKLNAIAPLISNFYLASYALINFCTFHAELIEPLGWRPTFKYYNMWVSLFSCLLCLVIMFLLDWITSLSTFIIFFALYLLVMYRRPDANWGSSTQAQVYKSALASSHRLTNVDDHVKTYRPQILLLAGVPNSRVALTDLAYLITKQTSLLMCADIISERLTYKQRTELQNSHQKTQNDNKIKAFSCVMDGLKFDEAAKSLMQCCGVGKLRPNILMMGFKNDWYSSGHEHLQSYFNVLHEAFDNCFGAIILRMPIRITAPIQNGTSDGVVNVGFDDDTVFPGADTQIYTISQNNAGTTLSSSMPNENATGKYMYTIELEETPTNGNPRKVVTNSDLSTRIPIEHHNADSIKDSFFKSKKKHGTLDVWWLYDDGGLTMLLPYILKSRGVFSRCKLRIFALTDKHDNLEAEEKKMSELLEKFRIKYSSLKMITDSCSPVNVECEELFNNLIKPFRLKADSSSQSDLSSGCCVLDEELAILSEKTSRQFRLKELLLQYSKDATMVVMSLPMPRKGLVSAPVYMAWLEILSRGMPPFLFVRGNQKSVLTFYS